MDLFMLLRMCDLVKVLFPLFVVICWEFSPSSFFPMMPISLSCSRSWDVWKMIWLFSLFYLFLDNFVILCSISVFCSSNSFDYFFEFLFDWRRLFRMLLSTERPPNLLCYDINLVLWYACYFYSSIFCSCFSFCWSVYIFSSLKAWEFSSNLFALLFTPVLSSYWILIWPTFV